MGKLRKSKGAGFISNIYNKHIQPKGHTAKFDKYITSRGDDEVIGISIGRKPVMSGIQKVFDVLSLGKFSQKKKQLGYDDVFHNYMLVTTKSKDGKFHTDKIERNHVIQSFDAKPEDFKGETYGMAYKKGITVKSLMENAVKSDPKLDRYTARKSNCQDFTKNIIASNDLQPMKEAKHIVEPQRADLLVDTLGVLKGIPNMVTVLDKSLLYQTNTKT